jgi:hypothetical protein
MRYGDGDDERWRASEQSILPCMVVTASSSASPVLAVLPRHELPWGGRPWSTRGDEVGGKGTEIIKSD